MSNSTAYNKGSISFITGKSLSDNPYINDSFEYFQWNKGYQYERALFQDENFNQFIL